MAEVNGDSDITDNEGANENAVNHQRVEFFIGSDEEDDDDGDAWGGDSGE